MATAFISYSRRDTELVRRLHAALMQQGLEGWVDWEGIPPADDWLRKVHRAIEGVDAFVFVMSPDSLASAVCADEVAHAVLHNKRIVPVVVREVNRVDHPDIEIPAALRRLNWVFFRAGDDFDAAVLKVVDAIRIDLAWVESHTRLLHRAIEWDAAERDDSFLLQKNDLVAAEGWLTRGPVKDPKPTALQSDYIIASRQAATRRQRRLTAAAVAATVLVGIGAVLATVQYVIAEIRREEALSRQLAAQSAAVMDEDPALGLLLGVYAHDLAPTAEASDALLAALDRVRGVRAFLPGEFLARPTALSSDGRLLAAARCTAEGDFRCTRSIIELWRVADPTRLATVELAREVTELAFTSDSKRLAVSTCCEGKDERPRAFVYGFAGEADAPSALNLITERAVPEGKESSAAAQFIAPAGAAKSEAILARVRHAIGEQVSGVRVVAADLESPGRVFAVIEPGRIDAPVGLELWDAASVPHRLGRVLLKPGSIWDATVRRDGKLAAAFACAIRASGRICDAGELAIIDATVQPLMTGKVTYDLPDWIRSLAVVPGDNLVLSGGCGKHDYSRCLFGELRLWRVDGDEGKPRGYEPVRTFGGAVDGIALAADGRSMALTSQRGKIALMQLDGTRASERGWLASPLETRFTARDKGEVSCAKQSVRHPVLLQLASQLARPDAICVLLEGFANDPTRTTGDEGFTFAINAAGTRVAVGGCAERKSGTAECAAGRAVVWSVAGGSLARQVAVDVPSGVTRMALSANGDRLAVATCRETPVQLCNAGKLELIEIGAAGAPRRTLVEASGAVTAIGFHPRGATLAYATCARLDDAGAARQCALAALRFIGLSDAVPDDVMLTGHRGSIVDLAFNPGGTLLASGAADGSVALWDPASRELLGPAMAAHAVPVEAIRFVSDAAFSSTTQDDEIEWRATPAEWKRTACRIANRTLTGREHARFVAGEDFRDACAPTTAPRGSALWRWLRARAGPSG